MSSIEKVKLVKVGLVTLGEKSHNITNHPDFQNEMKFAGLYNKEISKLAALGVKIVVLPERAFNLTKDFDSSIINFFGKTARQNHIFIVTGYTNFRNNRAKNSCLVLDDTGNPVVDYDKVHLVVGLENQFTPGNEPGLFKFNGAQTGTAICKDLDFPGHIKKYGIKESGVLFIPAWDFVTDAWRHSRVAVLRGVENGFSEVRCARLGRLTISDYFGKVTYEANSSSGGKTSLVGYVSLQHKKTLYNKFGDWFGILNIPAALIIIFYFKKKLRT